MAKIERIRARTPSKVLLLGSSGSGRESLLHYIDMSWQVSQRQRILKLVGTPALPRTDFDSPSSESVVAAKWREILRDVYEHIGMNCENVTLLIKRLDLIPPSIVNQLLSLTTTGDVPGAFTLDEQIAMATRVRDERLVGIEAAHTARIAHIEAAIKTQRDREYEMARQHELESRQAHSQQYFDEVESKCRDTRERHLAQAQLQFHQELDDFVRRREVETESVTATIMSLMRPLGITSGKWQQIIDRIRKRLSVVFIVDYAHEPLVRSGTPQLFTMCDEVDVPVLSLDALRVLVYGHLLAEVQPALAHVVSSVPSTSGSSAGLGSGENPATLSIESVKPFLWTLSGAAAEMHLAVAGQTLSTRNTPTSMAWAMVSRFVKLVSQRSREIELAERNEQRFLDVVAHFEAALTRLRGTELDLPSQIEIVQAEMLAQETKAAAQKENAHRIREIMLRFQEAAEEQVRITNEMQEQAQRELQIPLACVEEANTALMMIDKRHIVEIKSFTSPPLLVHLVLDAICVLFRYEPTWENARKILGDPNVVQTMLNFDKDAVPMEILGKLEKDYLSDERFNRQDVERQSVAASMMVVWVRAVHQYASARLLVKPALDRLDKAQARLKLLMQEFQVSKDRVMEAEVSWKATVALGEELEKQKKDLVARCESRATRLESGQLAFEFLGEDRQLAQARMVQIHMEKSNWLAWWNALIDACALTYLGSLPYRQRTILFDKWQQAYGRWSGIGTSEDTRAQCILVPSLSIALSRLPCPNARQDEEDEPIEAHDSIDALFESSTGVEVYLERVSASSTCFSRRRMHDVFLLSSVATTPGLFAILITDFHEQMEAMIVKCARVQWHWANLQLVYARAPDFDEVLVTAVRDGHQLLVLDVEPGDAVALPGRSGLKAIFDWHVTEEDGVQYLSLPAQRPCGGNKDGQHQQQQMSGSMARETVGVCALVPIHTKFKLVMTTHLGQDVFGDSLDHIPVVNAELSADEVQDAVLDHMWAPEGEFCSGGGVFNLDGALRDGMRALRDQDVKHAMLVELTEEGSKAGDFQIPLMNRVREQCNATKEGRLAVQQCFLDIRRRINRIGKGGVELARIGSAAFNALNSTFACATGKPPALALQIFLPLYFRALKPAPTSAFASPFSTPTASPVSSPRNRAEAPSTHRSLRSTINLARQVGRLVTATRQGSGIDADGAPAPGAVLSRLLHLLDPLLSTENDRQQFLTRLYISLESGGSSSDPKPKASNNSSVVKCDAGQIFPDPNGQAQFVSVQPVLTAVRLEQLCRPVDHDAVVETIRCIDGDNLGGGKAQVAAMFLSGCLSQSTEFSHAESSPVAKLFGTLTSVSTRGGRIQVSLRVFPELVPLLCQKAVHFYGDTPSATSLGTLDSQEVTGNWLTLVNSFPETTGTVLVTAQMFDSFSFLLHVYFGVACSLELRLAVTKHIAAQGTAGGLGKPYRLPRSVIIAPESSRAYNNEDYQIPQLSTPSYLLLTLGCFQEMLEIEKKHIDALETMPMALVNMSPVDQGQETWNQLFRILYRSVARPASVTHPRGHSSKITNGAGNLHVGKPSAALARLTSERNSQASLPSSPRLSSPKPSLMVRRESSSRSVLARESAAAMVTPLYPRIVSVVATPDAIPRHLKKNVVCFHLGDRRAEKQRNGGNGPSLQWHLQAAILRIVCFPFEATMTVSTKPHDGFRSSEDAGSEASKSTLPIAWPPELGLLLTSVTLFHALLAFRHEESLAVAGYGYGLPRYLDDALATSVGQVAVIVQEFDKRSSEAESSIRVEERGRRTILGVYTRLAADKGEEQFLERLLWECFEIAHRSMPQPAGSEQKVTLGEREVGLPAPLELPGEQTRCLECLSFPVTVTVTNLESWLDEMWSRVRAIDQGTDSQVRAAFFGVRKAFSVSNEALDGRHYPWIYQLGCGAQASDIDKTSFSLVVEAIQAILTNCLPSQQGGSVAPKGGVVATGSDTVAVMANSESEFELLKQIRDAMEAAHSRFILSIRQFFEELSRRIDVLCSRTRRGRMVVAAEGGMKLLDARQQTLPCFFEEDWVIQQAAATMQNKIPAGLHEILARGELHHPAMSASASLDDMLIWIQTWNHFLLRQHKEERSSNAMSADTTMNNRCDRWWAPAVEALAIPFAHIVDLSQTCGSQNQGLVVFSLRASPVNVGADTSSDNATSIHGHEEHTSASSEMFMALEGVWLFGAAWNEELEWLEPAVTWHPQRVSVIGTIVDPTRGGRDDSSAIPLDITCPSVTSAGERSELRSVSLLSTKPSKCLARWEIRASSALTALMTPYLTTHW